MRCQPIAALSMLSTCLALGAGCNGEIDGPSPCDLTYDLLDGLRVDTASHPSPVVGGTRFVIRGESFIAETSCAVPQVSLVGGVGGRRSQVILQAEILSPNDIVGTLPTDAASTLGGPGTFTGELEVRFDTEDQAGQFRAALPVAFELAGSLAPTAMMVEQTQAYLNDELTLQGSGFLDGDVEGVTRVRLDGTYETESGATRSVSGVSVAARLIEPDDRTRASFGWSPLIGGIEPGDFTGTVTVESTHAGGTTTSSIPLSVHITQQETVLFGISDVITGEPIDTICLGQNVDVVGRGFIGTTAAEGPDLGTTSFRLEGEFTPCLSGPGVPLNCDQPPQPVRIELIGAFSSGAASRYTVTVSNQGGVLHAVDFGAQRGTFVGAVTPVLTLGSERHDGIGLDDMTITLGPVRQVGWVRFLPQFSTSLDYFGLGAVEAEIRRRVVDRMQGFYTPPGEPRSWINVEFRTEEPVDFYAGGYAIIDVGGPDLNRVGLFGYDNTPGKDVGNLRLADHIGGRNAQGELDGYGYGGVFVESMLFWSRHPPAQLGPRPRGAPPADARFDAIFDPVRADEVVAGEWPSGAPPERLAQIEAAIDFLANMIADTTAHEFGHSLGLAQPFGGPRDFHNAIPGEGCLMDAGGDRPLEERARIEGNPGARFCQEELWYLQDILPTN